MAVPRAERGRPDETGRRSVEDRDRRGHGHVGPDRRTPARTSGPGPGQGSVLRRRAPARGRRRLASGRRQGLRVLRRGRTWSCCDRWRSMARCGGFAPSSRTAPTTVGPARMTSTTPRSRSPRTSPTVVRTAERLSLGVPRRIRPRGPVRPRRARRVRRVHAAPRRKWRTTGRSWTRSSAVSAELAQSRVRRRCDQRRGVRLALRTPDRVSSGSVTGPGARSRRASRRPDARCNVIT